MTPTELPAHEQELIERATAFAREDVAPDAEAWERERKMPVETVRRAAAQFGGLLVPREMGGAGASVTAASRVLEEIAKADLAFAFSLVVQLNMTGTVAKAGTEEQQRRFLPDLLEGKRICAFCLTEPEAGTDAAALTTQARAQGDGWRLDGEKAWVTNGIAADLLCIFAQDEGEPGPRNIAAYLLEGDNPGLERLPAYELMGGHAMGTTGLRLRDCEISSRDRLFGPGAGFKAAMSGIDLARVLLSAMCCGILEAGLDTTVAYAGKRKAFGKPIIAFQGLQFELAEVATKLEAARLLTYSAAAALDRGEQASVPAAHAKKFSTRAAFDGLGEAMQAMGGNGFRRDHPLARHLANAKMAQYLDGTTEVQNVVIGRDLADRAMAASS
jgi:alkylation response protein AidB-like acyl-CoA dehydrogenase